MRKLPIISILFMASICTIAQIPEKMSYQAVVRDVTGNLVSKSVVGMQLSILQGSATGTPVYVESQSPETNSNGLVSIEIGDGTPSKGTFAEIDWSRGTYFIKTEVDPSGGTSYTISGTTQVLSVPFALYAKTAEHVDYTELDPVFESSASSSITKEQMTEWDNKLDREIDASATNELQTLSKNRKEDYP